VGVGTAAPARSAVALDGRRVVDFARQHPPLTSVIVATSDSILAEGYFRGGRANRPVNVKSVSKSILSALVGLAIDDGHIESLDQPISTWFEDYPRVFEHPLKRRITLENLLTMRSGLETTSFRNYGPWVAKSDWVRGVLEQEVEAPPGTFMRYSTGSSHLVSVLLERATGEPTHRYAQRRLFGPMGLSGITWDEDPQGYDFGGNNLAMTPRQMLRFGQLYLRDGVVGERRVLPEGWVRLSWRPRTISSWNGFRYGYFWWTRRMGGAIVHYAWGHGGQRIFVIPEHDLVVVTTAALRANGRSPWGVNEVVDDLLVDEVLRPLLHASGSADESMRMEQ
jgi:CubicO group peptidase (beta-lactamase class C family)